MRLGLVRRELLLLTISLTLALGFALSLPQSACADGCEWFQTVLNGQIKTCSRCCNGEACRLNCN